MSENDFVILEVGGQIFKTKRINLLSDCAKGTLLPSLLSCQETEREKKTIIQLDRDPSFFPYILNYLRQPTDWIPPQEEVAIRQLCHEGKYYCMPESFFEKLLYKKFVEIPFTKSDPDHLYLETGLFTLLGLQTNFSGQIAHELDFSFTFRYHDLYITDIAYTISQPKTKQSSQVRVDWSFLQDGKWNNLYREFKREDFNDGTRVNHCVEFTNKQAQTQAMVLHLGSRDGKSMIQLMRVETYGRGRERSLPREDSWEFP